MSIGWALPGLLIAALAPATQTTHPATQIAQPATHAAQPAARNGRALVKLRRSRLGPILVDARGRTLYLFTQDKPRRALCTSDYLNCTKIWLPLMTTGRPRGAAGVKTRLLGTFHRTKPAGSQVTYNGHPLYLYVDDKHPGDLEGQGMFDYWYALSASGRPIKNK